MRSCKLLLIAGVLVALAGALGSAQGDPASAVAGEESHVRFGARHSLSTLPAQKERIAYSEQQLARASEPEPSNSSFRVRLPKGYRPRGKKSYGLVVWLSPDATGRCPPKWRGEFKRKRLIMVGPDEAGNDQPLARRIALALDALAGALANYRVDPERVFAIGFSGGGNVAAWLGLHYPDLFQGVGLLSGCDTYRPVPVPGKKGSFWRGSIPEPSAPRLAEAKQRAFVFFSGEDDAMARKQAEAVSALHRELGFQRVTLRLAPGLGHTPCSGKELRRVLVALEKKAEKKVEKKEPAPEAPKSRPTR